MNLERPLHNIHSGWSPLAAVALTTFAAIAVSIYSLLSGWVIIFQNLLYVPIVIACTYYPRRGLLFSVVLALLYFFLVIAFTGSWAAALQAALRVGMFISVAGLITFLSAQRRQVEEQLRHHRANLERLVEERTAELKRTADEARRHQDELLRVTRLTTLGEMAAGIAHELNQPLAAIVSYGDWCLRLLEAAPPDVPTLRANLEAIACQGVRAGDIMRRMRALAKRRPLCLMAVDVNQAARDVVLLLRSEMVSQAVQWQLELQEPLPAVWADRIQIEQVLLNLMRNAIEAMESIQEQPRLLTLRTKVVAENMLQVEVSDTGVGLATNDIDRVFEPFFTTKAEGLGMGLAICRSIIQMYQGCIWAESGPGRGCTFLFTLPTGSEQPQMPRGRAEEVAGES